MIINETFARELASDLLDINAVILRPNDPFTWASGWHSPIYCDNRLTLHYPQIRKKIAHQFTEFIKNEFSHIDVITGTATAGIPHASWIADALSKPMAYVRAKPKSYGMGNQIEGGVAIPYPPGRYLLKIFIQYRSAFLDGSISMFVKLQNPIVSNSITFSILFPACFNISYCLGPK